jgi:hypothetical protein
MIITTLTQYSLHSSTTPYMILRNKRTIKQQLVLESRSGKEIED